MESQELLKILELVKEKKLSPDEALQRVKHLPFEDLDFAKVDHHRALRQGFAEVVFAKGKTVGQVAEIVKAMLRKKDSRHNVLITRADAKVFAALCDIFIGIHTSDFRPVSALADYEEMVIAEILDSLMVLAGERNGIDDEGWRRAHERVGPTGPYGPRKQCADVLP